jgi:hypothetical protein
LIDRSALSAAAVEHRERRATHDQSDQRFAVFR